MLRVALAVLWLTGCASQTCHDTHSGSSPVEMNEAESYRQLRHEPCDFRCIRDTSRGVKRDAYWQRQEPHSDDCACSRDCPCWSDSALFEESERRWGIWW